VLIVTFSVRAVPGPQELFAETVTSPLVAPGVTFIDVEVELPVHPDGNVHVYEVAPVTGDML
jgi:hypothetical protein